MRSRVLHALVMLLLILISNMPLCAQNTDVSDIPTNVFDYKYQRSEQWRGTSFSHERSFLSRSYYMVGMSSDGLWGVSSLLGSNYNGVSSNLAFGYRLAPVFDIELGLSYGVLPYANWKVSRTDIDYYEAAFSRVYGLDAKVLFNITSYASRLEDPSRLELYYGAGLGVAYSDSFSFGASMSLRLKYNITNMLGVYVEPELSYYDNRLNNSSLDSDRGVLRPSVSAGISMRIFNDYQLTTKSDSPLWKPSIMDVALRTNLLYWAIAMPNIGVEIPIHNNYSLVAEFAVPWYKNRDSGFTYQMINASAQSRYWFKGCYERGFFGGLYAAVGYYDLQYNQDGIQSDLYFSAGAVGGYYLPLGSSLGLEFSLSVGFLSTDYKKYEAKDDGYLVYQSTEAFEYMGPTNGHVTIIWRPNFNFIKNLIK